MRIHEPVDAPLATMTALVSWAPDIRRFDAASDEDFVLVAILHSLG